jgi:multiple sugar transport system substrate-binding protein
MVYDLKRTSQIQRNSLRILFPAFAIALATACSQTGEPAPDSAAVKPEEKHEPVTITIGVKKNGYLTDEEFKRYISDPVSKKYPWITAEKILYDDKLIPELIASNTVPDLIITNNVNGIPAISEAKLLKPMNDAEWKNNGIDLSRIPGEYLDSIRGAAQSDLLVAVPYTTNFSGLYYNKDIFDKFAVPYPKDGMTWQDATELAKRLTRLEDNVQYRGLEPNVPERMASQLSLPFVDVKTNRAIVNNDLWKKVLQQAADIYLIPGNGKHQWKTSGINAFTKDRTLAMLADVNIIGSARLGELADLRWDIASYPVFPEAPGKGMGPDMHILVPVNVSKHQEDAFRVISVVLSDEVQLDMAKQGKLSVLKGEKFQAAFGQDLPFMKDKNISAIFKTSAASPYQPSLYDTKAMSIIQAELRNMFQKGKDVNSALRDAEEQINSAIKEANGQ